jgi:phage terminase small subunit
LPVANYRPPAMPPRLTKKQQKAWREITENPALAAVDESLLVDYIETVLVAEKAFNKIKKDGVVLKDGRANPACRIRNQAETHLLILRRTMLLTPKERHELTGRKASAHQPAPSQHAKPRKRKWGVVLD